MTRATRSPIRRLAHFILLGAALLAPLPAHAGDGYDDLVELFGELREWQARRPADGVVDYGAEAMAQRVADIAALQRRLGELDIADWPVAERVDYLVVRAELDQQEFVLRVTRPWARDPVFYIAGMLETAFTDLPVEGERLESLRRELRAVPEILARARVNLTEVAADYADLAIRSLTRSDGVENQYPYRETPPPGVIGWYQDLLERAARQLELTSDIAAALTALQDFNEWLVDNRDAMNGPNGVGKEALDWFILNGLLLPYTSDEILVLGERELDRLWAFYALERHRNRDLPEIAISDSREEYQSRIAETDELVRDWLEREAFITIPDYIPVDWREMGYNVPWIVRATPPNFWEQVQFRDPAPDHLHAVIPGHRFDALVAQHDEHPIRGRVNFHSRWQGWAVYLEEGPLQLGIFDAQPRTRELIYVFGLWRAARTIGDVRNQRNEMTAQETAEYWMDVTPWMDPDVSRKYAYLRPLPGHGLDYTVGNIQMFRLLAARKRQLGEDFVLREFHDDFIAMGRIPIALIHYQMTGDDRDVSKFRDRVPLETLLGGAPER